MTTYECSKGVLEVTSPTQSKGATGIMPIIENLYRAAARIRELKNMYMSLGMSRLILLCSNCVKAELTMNMALIGFITKATVIIIVQILMPVPVIQNMKSVIKIYLLGLLANSQAFPSSTSICVRFRLPEFWTTMSVVWDLKPRGSFSCSFGPSFSRGKNQD